MGKRSGITIFELLIVITIIAVLAALLIPAVFWARESARKTTCTSQLRQFGVALQTYETSHKKYPASNIMGFNCFTQLLPYLDHSALYDQLEFSQYPELTDSFHLMQKNRPAIFVCPSEPTAPDARFESSPSYATNNGTGFLYSDSIDMADDTGAFTTDSGQGRKVSDFPDGLSNTVFISEMSWHTEKGPGAVYNLPNQPGSISAWEAAVDQCDAKVGGVVDNLASSEWFVPGLFGSAYLHLLAPNARNCLFDGKAQRSVFSTSSWHSGGVHSLLGSGSVRFVSDSISIDVWRAVGTRDRSETSSF